MPEPQATLIDVAPTTGTAERPKRATSKGIGAGDIVLLDKKGRRFHALVTELEQLETGRFELVVRPLDSRISWRTASVREVIEVWRRAGRRRYVDQGGLGLWHTEPEARRRSGRTSRPPPRSGDAG